MFPRFPDFYFTTKSDRRILGILIKPVILWFFFIFISFEYTLNTCAEEQTLP